ncbi:bifunctional enoyl-CoA hydratase/phosphate acetyltransferase [uncultured Odoribacter sp.]|uniref:bifunctional enoyl-CoA hydratase/phosphate acetyltransferase n=1 Tax=uncultured Odoribacter sp. TaxID=876416 RepID=UPI00262CCCF1|nr:bifunctional enoyl-CoA hydratase/phosphate acetyltransferase [uncultured Odoribacter sp.]
MRIEKISDIYESLKKDVRKKRLAVAYANDSHSIEAVHAAVKMGLIEATLVGDEKEITKVCKEQGYDLSCFEIVHEPVDIKGAQKAVALVREGKADIIMKGLVSTDKYMRAILNKEKGLVEPNTILSHVTVMECPSYHKLLVISDVAVIPLPDLNQKIAMIKYVTLTAKALGVDCPKVAMIAPTEQVLPKIQSTVDAAILSKMAERGQICNSIIVDGPMALDVAIDKEAAQIKKVRSVVAGDADCLVFPNLEAGNVFYKTNTKICKSDQGAILVGAKVPSVLSSRGDSVETKLNSIALAALLA